jgi:hypothetical protein
MTDEARSFDRGHLSRKESHADPELIGGEKQIKFFIDSHLIKYIKSAKLVELK